MLVGNGNMVEVLGFYIQPKLRSYEPGREKPAFCICENKEADQLCAFVSAT